MAKKRQTFSKEFKAKVALETFRLVRTCSFNTNKIEYEQHCKNFFSVLCNPYICKEL